MCYLLPLGSQTGACICSHISDGLKCAHEKLIVREGKGVQNFITRPKVSGQGVAGSRGGRVGWSLLCVLLASILEGERPRDCSCCIRTPLPQRDEQW